MAGFFVCGKRAQVAIKPTHQPLEIATGGSTFVNGVIYFLVAFHFVRWTDEQIVGAAFVGNLLLAVVMYVWLKITTTARANPKTSDGTPLEPAPTRTRGIQKG
jgi:hypothetical protein